MAFSIFNALNRSISLGVFARANNLSEARSVTSSFVRKLKTQEINTKNGLPHFRPTSVTEGVLSRLVSRFKMSTIRFIFVVDLTIKIVLTRSLCHCERPKGAKQSHSFLDCFVVPPLAGLLAMT